MNLGEIKNKLLELGLKGNGKNEKIVKLQKFEKSFDVKPADTRENEYGSEDFHYVIYDDENDYINIILEVSHDKITHNYY